ncbi:hypothetical protein GCM10022379_62110 [Micromonospora maritima]
MEAGNPGSDIAGSDGAAAGNVRRPRTEPSATTSSTTITITPIATRTHGDEVMAAPGEEPGRRVRDMVLRSAGRASVATKAGVRRAVRRALPRGRDT